MQLVDITHTTKPSERPTSDAKLFRDLDTGETKWDIREEGCAPAPEVPPVPMPKPAKRANKKGEGDA